MGLLKGVRPSHPSGDLERGPRTHRKCAVHRSNYACGKIATRLHSTRTGALGTPFRTIYTRSRTSRSVPIYLNLPKFA